MGFPRQGMLGLRAQYRVGLQTAETEATRGMAWLWPSLQVLQWEQKEVKQRQEGAWQDIWAEECEDNQLAWHPPGAGG